MKQSWTFHRGQKKVTVTAEEGTAQSLMVQWENGVWLPLDLILHEYFSRAEDGQMTTQPGEF